MNKKKEEIIKFPIKFLLKKTAKQFSFSYNDIKAIKPLIQRLYGNQTVPDSIFEEALNFVLSRMEGTPFFKSVWREITKVDKGKTTTYTDIANTLGGPQKARAVAKGCSRNPFPLLIPCHRVVGKNGIGGYTINIPYLYEAFDIEPIIENAIIIKKNLLDNERNI